jgi:hypothetical protein
MNRLTENLIGLIPNILTLGIYRYCNTNLHHSQVNQFCEVSKKATYKEFKDAFEKIDWDICKSDKNSLVLYLGNDVHTQSEFHASIIKINGIGYKLTSYGFFMANILRRKKIKEIVKHRIDEIIVDELKKIGYFKK